MGCIKSKEVIHLDAISQQNVDNSYPIQANKLDSNLGGSSINYLSERQMHYQKENSHGNRNSTNYNTVSELPDKNNLKVTDVYQTITNLSKKKKCSWYKVKKIGEDIFNAMKVIEVKDIIDIKQYPSTIEKIINLNHNGLVDIVNYFQDENKFYIITEFISGGELYEYILNKYFLSEKAIQFIILQLLNVFDYLHKYHIFSNRISIKNILVTNKNEDDLLDIKITNYFSSNYVKNNSSQEKVSSQFHRTIQRDFDYYTAPEIINEEVNIDYKKGIVWSIGVIMYILISGSSPFEGECQEDINNEILKKKLDVEQLRQLSIEGKDFLNKILERNVNERLSIEGCLSHRWIKSYYQLGIINTNINTDFRTSENYVEATIYYLNSSNNSLSKLNELFKENQTHLTKIHIIKSVEQYESEDEVNKRMKIKLLECLPVYEGNIFTLKDYLTFINQMIKNKWKKEKEMDANSRKDDSMKNSLIKGNDENSESEDSFIIYSEEKLANKFDREKFLQLIDKGDSDLSDMEYDDHIIQGINPKQRKKM